MQYVQPVQELLERGGPVVAILLFMSVIATMIVIAKMIQFAVLGIARNRHADRSLNAWQGGHIRQAVESLNESSSHPVRWVCGVLLQGKVQNLFVRK